MNPFTYDRGGPALSETLNVTLAADDVEKLRELGYGQKGSDYIVCSTISFLINVTAIYRLRLFQVELHIDNVSTNVLASQY